MLEKVAIFLIGPLIVFNINHALADTKDLPFGGQSFSIWTTVFKYESDSVKPIAHLKESYSMDLSRARIEMDQIDRDSRFKTFYHNGMKDITVYTKNFGNKTSCVFSNLDQFNFMVGCDDWPYEFVDAPTKFIIGPAKVIFNIAKNFDVKNMPRKEIVDEEKNLKLYEITLEQVIKDGQKYTFEVQYDESTLSQSEYPIPSSVSYSIDDRRKHLFSFSRPEVLETKNARCPQATSNSQVVLDYFSLPLGSGCSVALKNHEETIFFEKELDFAFTAREDYSSELHESTWKQTIYVAYQSILGSMRIDRTTRGHNSKTTKQLHELKLGRSFHILDQPAKNPADKVVDMSSEATNTQCMVSPLPVAETAPPTSRLLTGSRLFVHMGSAWVRGIEALVYESTEAIMPYWLDMPLIYTTDGNAEAVRESDMDPKLQEQRQVNVVVYLRKQHLERRASILLMEIEKTRPPVKYIDSKQSFSFFDFKWELDHEAPDGSRQDELFSFADQCSLNQGPEFRLSFDLRGHAISSMSSLAVPSSRNLALLALVQEVFFVQASLTSDIESRLTQSPRQNANQNDSLIETSLRFKKSPNKMVLLKYLGQGIGKQTSTTIQLRPGATTIRECFHLASHLLKDVYFGYDPVASACLIDTNTVAKYADTDSEEQKGPFKMGKGLFYEIYRTIHTDNYFQNWRYFRGIDEERKYINRLVNLEDSNRDSRISFKITKVQVEDNRKKVFSNITEQTDKIMGFGLLPSDQPGAKSWVVNPLAIVDEGGQPEEDSESEMTIDQCKTACMTDFSCRSYSTCLRESRIQCTLSEVAFDSNQFKSDILSKAKRNSKVKVNVVPSGAQEPLPVEVLRNPVCQINNKIYTDFYRLGTSYHADTTAKDVYQSTENAEDCARMCLEANLRPIEADMSHHFDKNNKIIISSRISEFFRDRWLVIGDHVCSEFMYASNVDMEAKLKNDLDADSLNRNQVTNQSSVVGYCIFDKGVVNKGARNSAGTNQAKPETDQRVFLKTMRYYFNFINLYGVTHGVKLRASPLSQAEEEALVSLFQYDYMMSESQLSSFESLTKTKFNHQKLPFMDVHSMVTKCADDCASQRRQLYPSCRSFDIVTDFVKNRVTTRCYLNSMTLKEAKAHNLTNLIEYNSKKSRQIWHYEPKAGFVLSESLLIYDMAHHHPIVLGHSAGSSFASFLGILFVASLGMACGLMLGLRSAKKILDYSGQVRRESVNMSLDLNDID